MRTIYTTLFLLLAVLGVYVANAQCNLIIDQNFDHWSDKKYTVADAKSDFNNKIKPWTASTYRGISAPGAASNLIGNVAQETWVVNGELRAEYKKDDAGGYAGGFLFDPYFDGVEEAYLEYKVKFDDNFFWATGGKLPGLGGSTQGINSETTGRGAIPSGGRYDENGTGFSARLMWRRNRDQTNTPYFILYSYFAEKPDGSARKDGEAGDGIRIFTGLEDNHWYTIRQYIKLNTPGQDNGTVVMWIDGQEVYRNTKHNIRQSGKSDLKINALIMNTYRGGSRTDPVWHSPRDEYAFFDDFKVWTGCSEPPGSTANQAPVGSFTSPAYNEIDEGYGQLYVNIDASDPDGDDISLQLIIDGKEVRTEGNAPYEWGHVSANQDYTSETTGLSVGDHLFEVVITDSKGASTTISKTITVNRVNVAPSIEITSPSADQVFFLGDDVTITALATDDIEVDRVNFKLDGGYHSQGQTGDNSEYSTTYSFTSPGFYELGARVFDNEGESTEVSVTIEVRLVTGTASSRVSQLNIYPNPASNFVRMDQAMSWELFSSSGISIANGFGNEITVADLDKGVYFIKTSFGVNKIVVE